MIGIIITLFGFSNMVQFSLEIPIFLPQPSTVICEEMDESNFDPNCQHEDYSVFRSWCLGNRCDDHAVKGYVKSIDEKPKISSKVNAGIYVLDSDLLNNFPKDLYMDMPSLINETASKKESSVAAFPIYEYWLDIGQIGDYKRAQIDFISNFLNEK